MKSFEEEEYTPKKKVKKDRWKDIVKHGLYEDDDFDEEEFLEQEK